jgi:chemotaxis protein CheX
VKTFLQEGPTTKIPLDPSWKTVLEHAAIEVFELMAGIRLEGGLGGEIARGEQTAMVGLAGALCGMLTVCCSREMAHRLASRMLGGEAALNPATVRDALGELCNMVAGNFKAKISNLADKCMLSVPTVITGSDYEMATVAPTDGISIYLTLEGDPVNIALTIHA